MSNIPTNNGGPAPSAAIEKTCYWFSTVNRLAHNEPLTGTIEADIAIVGAGFTGLWTAWFLKQLDPKLEIVIVEQGFAGYGASGRNGGMVAACLDHSHDMAIAHFGREEAARLAVLGRQNIQELASYAQGCDFEQSGWMQVALTKDHIQEFRETADETSGLGVPGYRMLTQEETRKQLNSPLYLGALHATEGGIINPLKLVQKLKSDLQKLGVRIYERTRVTQIAEQSVSTAGGLVEADRVILATDAYTHRLVPRLLWRYIPFYDYVIVSRPLSQPELASIGWAQRQGVIDGRNFFKYYRLTADNRVLWGTSEAAYYPDSLVSRSLDNSQSHYALLKESFARHFPQLATVEFPFGWGGPIASTTRMTPFFGSMHHGTTLYGLGYTGQGIGATRVAGKILAHMALTKPHELLQLKMVTDKPYPYPPEPIRTWAVKAVTWSLRRVDQGHKPNLLLKMLDALGIGLSS